MKKKLAVILVIFGVLVGNLVVGVPVARGLTWFNFTTAPSWMRIVIGNGKTSVVLYGPGVTQQEIGNFGACQNVSMSFFCSVAMTINPDFGWLAMGAFDKCVVGGETMATITDGAYHEVTIAASGDYANVGCGWTWNWSGFINLPVGGTGGYYVVPDVQEAAVALSVTIAGPSSVSSTDGGTWTGTGAGGSGTGYTYAWGYHEGSSGYFADWPYSGASFTRVLPVGTWTLQVKCTDSLGAVAYADQVVVSSLIVGGYKVDLLRSGSYGQDMSAIVHNAEGTFIGISDASGTQGGIYADLAPPAEKSFGYYDMGNGAADGSTGYWRWVMSITVGEVTSPPPKDFWFKTTLGLTDSTVLDVLHHFSDYNESVSPWYPPGGGLAVAPEVAPAASSNLPLWVQALLDALYVLLAPVILVFEVVKMLVNWAVGLLVYLGAVISIVLSFGLLVIRWLVAVVASVLNFGTAAPGSYVSIQGLMTLAGGGVIPGDTSVFKDAAFGVSTMDGALAVIHDWIMESGHQWIWWGVFTYAFMAFVLQLGGSGEGED